MPNLKGRSAFFQKRSDIVLHVFNCEKSAEYIKEIIKENSNERTKENKGITPKKSKSGNDIVKELIKNAENDPEPNNYSDE